MSNPLVDPRIRNEDAEPFVRGRRRRREVVTFAGPSRGSGARPPAGTDRPADRETSDGRQQASSGSEGDR